MCEYAPRYETLMSRDTPEMQVEKLVMADLLHSNQLTETSSHHVGPHPWSLDLVRQQIAAKNLPDKVLRQKFDKPAIYEEKVAQETERLLRIYMNLLRDRYLPMSLA